MDRACPITEIGFSMLSSTLSLTFSAPGISSIVILDSSNTQLLIREGWKS